MSTITVEHGTQELHIYRFGTQGKAKPVQQYFPVEAETELRLHTGPGTARTATFSLTPEADFARLVLKKRIGRTPVAERKVQKEELDAGVTSVTVRFETQPTERGQVAQPITSVRSVPKKGDPFRLVSIRTLAGLLQRADVDGGEYREVQVIDLVARNVDAEEDDSIEAQVRRFAEAGGSLAELARRVVRYATRGRSVDSATFETEVGAFEKTLTAMVAPEQPSLVKSVLRRFKIGK